MRNVKIPLIRLGHATSSASEATYNAVSVHEGCAGLEVPVCRVRRTLLPAAQPLLNDAPPALHALPARRIAARPRAPRAEHAVLRAAAAAAALLLLEVGARGAAARLEVLDESAPGARAVLLARGVARTPRLPLGHLAVVVARQLSTSNVDRLRLTVPAAFSLARFIAKTIARFAHTVHPVA